MLTIILLIAAGILAIITLFGIAARVNLIALGLLLVVVALLIPLLT